MVHQLGQAPKRSKRCRRSSAARGFLPQGRVILPGPAGGRSPGRRATEIRPQPCAGYGGRSAAGCPAGTVTRLCGRNPTTCHISKKTIQEAVRRTSDALTPHYEAIHAHILEGKRVNGDETGWRVAGLLYWVWCIVGDDAVWFNIQKGRGSEEAKKMLEEFVGMVTSDSWPARNHVGTEHQKCHLHYRRDISTTMEENKGAEFQAFARKLKQILWDSHTKEKGHDPDDDLQTRERKRRNLMRRLAYLMNKDYTDGDCKR